MAPVAPDSGDKPRSAVGRPRSERARTAILSAAADLLFEQGIDHLTVDGIAHRAGVSKATIYRWWPSKAAVAVDAYVTTVGPLAPIRDRGDLAAELAEPALAQLRLLRDTRVGTGLKSIIAAAQHDPEVGRVFRERWLVPRRQMALEPIRRAQQRGELPLDADGEAMLDAIFGPIYYRLLAGHAPLDDSLVGALVQMVLAAVPRT
ncbi:MAG: TetR/AcrR family transcriptional regulator [Actinomycetota bacterium]